MTRVLSAFYSPDDDLEHAMIFIAPAQGMNSGLPIKDVSFSPSTQGHFYPALAYSPQNTAKALAAVFCPVDNHRYIFFATADNGVYWTRYASPTTDAPDDPLIGSARPQREVNTLVDYSQSAIVDLGAHFNGSELEVVALMNNGNVWRMSGAPWLNQGWNVVPVWDTFEGAQHLSVFDGAGASHVMLATDSTVTEVWSAANGAGKDVIATFSEPILDVSGYYTPHNDQARVIVATRAGANQTRLSEVSFQPAQTPPVTVELAVIPHLLGGIGAYEKPDHGQHVIMCTCDAGGLPNQVFLSWYSPGPVGFDYGPWPVTTSW